MGFTHYLNRVSSNKRKRKQNKRHLPSNSNVTIMESLEPRLMLAIGPIGVDTFDDVVDPNDGLTSLREALVIAAQDTGDDIINLPTGWYGLTQGELLINDPTGNLSIMGVGPDGVAQIDGQYQSRVFNISSGSVVNMYNLGITGGYVGVGTGGGILNSGTLLINNSLIDGNSAEDGGGILNSDGGALILMGSTVSNNSATGAFASGGGINNYYGTVMLIGSMVTGNSSSDNGGGIGNFGTMTLINSMVTGNSADFGGGITNSEPATLTLANSTISGNSATSDGGGIFDSSFSPLVLTNSTVAGNSADYSGDGIFNWDSRGPLLLNNSIVSLNDAGGGENVLGSFTNNSSLIGGDPGFVRNPSPGIDGVWGTIDDDFGDLRLTAASPAVDTGDNLLAVDGDGLGLTTDIDGNPRIVNALVDIGAYEYQGQGYYEVWGTNVDHWQSPENWITGPRPVGDAVLLGRSDNANDQVYFPGQYDYYIIVTRAQVELDAIQGSTQDYASSFYTSSNWNTLDMTGAPDGVYTTLGDEAHWGPYASITVLQNPQGLWGGLTLDVGNISPAMNIGIGHYVSYDGMADPFWYEFWLDVNDYGQVSSAEFQAPDGVWRPLWLENEEDDDISEWGFWQEDFNSIPEITAAFPQGFYTVRATTSLGPVETTFYFGNDNGETQTPLAWPTQKPEIINPLHGQVDVPVDTIFEWEQLTDPNTNNVWLDIEVAQEQDVYNQNFWGDGLGVTTAGPADLQPGENYALEIDFANANWRSTPEGFGVHSALEIANSAVFRTAGGSGGAVLPDLAITGFTYPPGVYNPGDSFDFAIAFGNIGEGNAIAFDLNGQAVPHNFLEGRLSTDQIWGNADDVILSQVDDTWWMGGEFVFYNTSTDGPPREGLPVIPLGTPEGTYYGAVMIDANNQITESDENNNIWWSATNDFVVGQPTPPVTFNDANLETAIRNQIGDGQGGPFTGSLTPGLLAGMTYLDASSSNISDLTGLENCTNLTNLWLYDNQISNLLPLAGLTGLVNLSLMANNISNISPLSNLNQVQWLDLSGNQISDLTPLGGLTGLLAVHLDDNQISDISPLGGLTGLEWIAIWNNQISDLSPLISMTGLREVQVWDNPLGPSAYTTVIPALELRGVEVTVYAYYEVWGTNVDHWQNPENWITGSRPVEDAVLLGTSDNANDQVSFAGQYDYYIIVTRAQVELDAIQGSTQDYANSFYTSSNWNTFGMTGAPDGVYTTLGNEALWGAYASITVLQNPNGNWQSLTLDVGNINPAMNISIGHEMAYEGLAAPFEYEFWLDIKDYGQVYSAEFQAPDGQWRPLRRDADEDDDDISEWGFWHDRLNSIAEIEAAFPQGSYSIRATTSFGLVETTFYFGNDNGETQTPLAWPTQIPVITTPLHDQVDVPVDTLFQWQPLTDPNISSIHMSVEDVQRDEVFHQDFGGEGLGATSAGPAYLQPGENYVMDIDFSNTNWRSTLEGFGVHSAVEIGNAAVFRTADGPGPAALPDLAITDFTYPPEVYNPGDSFDFTIDLGNIGDGNAIAYDLNGQAVPFNIEMRLSTDQTWDANDAILMQFDERWWLGGDFEHHNTAPDSPPPGGLPIIPLGTLDGPYYLGIAIDADDQIVESNEGNNTLWVEFIVGDGVGSNVDLTVQALTTDITAVAGKETTASVNLRNLGINNISAPFNVTLHQRGDTDFSSQTDIIATKTINSIASNGINRIDFTLTTPSTPGTYYLNVMADNGSVIDESNEANNWGGVITLTVINPTHVLNVGVRNNPVHFAGDIAARQMHTAFGYSSAVTTNELLTMNVSNAGNRTALINAINDMKNTVAPGDTFVLYVASQAYAFTDGDETPVQGHYNTAYQHWTETAASSGDEYLYLSTANGDANDYLTDDDLAALFVTGWNNVKLVFILDAPYSGGFFGENGDDLSQLGDVELLAAAQESQFAWMMMDAATGLGINTFGTDLAATLGQFRNNIPIVWEDVFRLTNHEESVYRKGLNSIYLADGNALAGINILTAVVGTDADKWVKYTDDDGSVVKVRMTRGQSRLTFNGTDLHAETIGVTTYITGENITMDRIDVTYSSASSKLAVYVRGGDGMAEVGTIAGLNPLGSLRASKVTLTGQLEMFGGGYIKYLRLGNIINGADITMLGDGATKGVTFIAREIGAGTDFNTASPIRYMRVTNWESGLITSPWIRSIKATGNARTKVAGNFGATINTADAYRGYGLYKAYIAGEITGGVWNIAAGAVGYVTTRGGTDADWKITVADGSIRMIKSYGSLAGEIRANGQNGWIGKIYAIGNLGQTDRELSIISEGKNRKGVGIGYIKARGEVLGSSVNITTAGGLGRFYVSNWAATAGENVLSAEWIKSIVSRKDFGADIKTHGQLRGYGLKSLRVNGWIINSSILTTENIGKIVARAVDNSQIFAGVQLNVLNSSELPGLENINTGPDGASIYAFYTLGGLPGLGNYSFINSTLAADNLYRIRLRSTDPNDNGTTLQNLNGIDVLYS